MVPILLVPQFLFYPKATPRPALRKGDRVCLLPDGVTRKWGWYKEIRNWLPKLDRTKRGKFNHGVLSISPFPISWVLNFHAEWGEIWWHFCPSPGNRTAWFKIQLWTSLAHEKKWAKNHTISSRLVVWNMAGLFSHSVGNNHHPNWRSPSFFGGVGIPPTSQYSLQ